MSVTSGGEHDECMICLESLLNREPDEDDEDDTYIESSVPAEVGAVWPCGHCFHLKCWNHKDMKKDKCPTCQQPVALFSKIFISAPPPRCRPVQQHSLPLTSNEREELEQYRAMMCLGGGEESATAGAVGAGSERMLLRDMERQSAGSNNAKMRQSMTMMMMVQSRDLRRAERALLECQEEHDETKDVLRVAQTELESAHKEIADLKPRMEQLQKQVRELQLERQTDRHHQLGSSTTAAAATPPCERDRKKIALLQEKLERAKEKLVLKNKQLSRRNKELAAKKKQLSTTAARGEEEQRASRKTSLELERTKKELELLKELDSFTMEGSASSMGLSMIWD